MPEYIVNEGELASTTESISAPWRSVSSLLPKWQMVSPISGMSELVSQSVADKSTQWHTLLPLFTTSDETAVTSRQ